MFNKLTLVGRFGKDAEARGTNGTVTAIDVITSNYYVKKDGQAVDEVERTQCVAFGKLAELVMKQGKKGDLVLVEGLKKTDAYEKDGQKRTSVLLQMDTFRRLSWSQEAKPVETKPVATKPAKVKA